MMYSQVQTLKNKYPGIDRLYCKGDISLLDNVLVKKIGVVGPQNSTSKSVIAAADMAYTLTNISDNFVITTRLTPGVDVTAHRAAIHNPRVPNMRHRTIAIIPIIDSNKLPYNTKKLQDEIIKNNGLIISMNQSSDISTDSKGTMISRSQLDTNVGRLMAIICDAIIFHDFDYAPNTIKANLMDHELARYGDPMAIYSFAVLKNKPVYLSTSVDPKIPKILSTEAYNNVELQQMITKMYYDSIGNCKPVAKRNEGLC